MLKRIVALEQRDKVITQKQEVFKTEVITAQQKNNEEIKRHLNEVKNSFAEQVHTKERETTSIIEDIKQNSHNTIETIRVKASELESSLKFRIEDCETLVKSRINEDYVKTLGMHIENNIVDAFDRKNRRTIEEIQKICGAFGRKQEHFMAESEQTLSKLRGELKKFEKDLETKVTLKCLDKYKGEVADSHKFLDSQITALRNTIASST